MPVLKFVLKAYENLSKISTQYLNLSFHQVSYNRFPGVVEVRWLPMQLPKMMLSENSQLDLYARK